MSRRRFLIPEIDEPRPIIVESKKINIERQRDKELAEQLKLKLFKEYADERLEFVPLAAVPIRDVRFDYTKWASERPDLRFSFPMTFNHAKLCQADPRYRFAVLKTCSFCGVKSFKGCCPDYSQQKRSTALFLTNARIKSSPDTPGSFRENDNSTSDHASLHSEAANPDNVL